MADHSSTGDDSCKPLTSLTRRELIKSIGGLAAGAFASTLLPSNVRRALANPMDRPASIRDIKHVVLLMQENRSEYEAAHLPKPNQHDGPKPRRGDFSRHVPRFFRNSFDSS